MLIYVAGPIRADTPEQVQRNIEAAGKVAHALWKMGHSVICPHYNTKWNYDQGAQLTHEEFMRGDLMQLSRCDCLVALRRWVGSEGAYDEVRAARHLGLFVTILPEEWTVRDLPPLHPTEVRCPQQARAFAEVLGQMYRMHLEKNRDYSPANIMATGELGLVTRLWDKTARLLNLMGFRVEVASSAYEAPQEPKHESIDDTLRDLSVYGIIHLLLRGGVWGK